MERYRKIQALDIEECIQELVDQIEVYRPPIGAQVCTNHIIIGNRQRLSQLCGQTAFRTPNTDHQRTLSGVHGLER